MSEMASKSHSGHNSSSQGSHACTPRIQSLVHEHYAVLYRYAYRLTGKTADAEDLVQQTFLAAQEKLHQLRDAHAARGWLFQILRRHFLKACRKRSPQNEADARLDMNSVSADVEPQPPFDAELIQQKLDELPDRFRLALLMYYFEEKSYESIAQELEIPIGTVMSRLARARAHLRSRLHSVEVTH